MDCAARLVEMFGSQAEVARAFQLDRAVVHNWVKTGYVPARWAGEVERVTRGRISAVEIVNEASAKNPVRVKSRPEDAPFGLPENDMTQFAPAKRIQSFHPPQRTLMGPGPTEIHPRVLTTMSQPAIGYLDPIFVEMMEELKSLLRYVYQTKNPLTFPLSGPGSVGMEYCFVNMVAPGDKVIVCQNGVFGGRMLENAIRCGGTPVLVEDNPSFRALFGSIEYQVENDVLVTDFSRIRAGSLLQAHGGFLMLHLPDLVADPLVWEKLRRFLRSGRLQIEEPGTQYAPSAVVSLLPEAVDVEVKIVLIGSRDEYYELQEIDAEFVRHFRVKVDFAESFAATAETRRATAIFIAHASRRLGLPHFSSAAVARLLEEMHREADDQRRQSAIFAHLEALVAESAAVCTARLGARVEAADVEAALQARLWRHNYPDQRLHESIAEGELLISVHGGQAGRINGLTQVDLGDHRFGFPVCVSARTFPGKEGVLNIEREVEMSGPNHDKGVFILETYLIALFGHVAPLSLNASLVFEQEYHGVEGDSASCAELIALLSSLSGVPVKQGIAVTGAVNQHGDVLPVGGINEKIEGFFRVCEAAGLDGAQGVLVPRRNLRHLMLGRHVLAAVREGRFHVHAVEDVSEAIELATGVPAGVADEHGNYPHGSVLGAAQKTLHAYRRACHVAEHPPQKVGHRGRYSGG